jgi:hypothetical protein
VRHTCNAKTKVAGSAVLYVILDHNIFAVAVVDIHVVFDSESLLWIGAHILRRQLNLNSNPKTKSLACRAFTAGFCRVNYFMYGIVVSIA